MIAPEPPTPPAAPGTVDPARRLVVSYNFAPSADTSAIVAAKRVRARGEPVDVISNTLDEIRSRDTTLADVTGSLVRRHAVLQASPMFGSWKSVGGFCTRGERTLRAWAEEPGGTPYTSVYSRSHFIHSHFLAALVKLERPEVTWQAEFSDPASRNAEGVRRKGGIPDGPLMHRFRRALADRDAVPPEDATVFEWAEHLTYALADEVLFTNAAQRDLCLDYLGHEGLQGVLRDKAVIAPHPSLPASFYSLRSPDLSLDPGVVNIGYFGSFYASQDPRQILGAFDVLAPEDRRRVRLHVFTGATEELSALVRELGVEDCVQVRQRLEFLDFLAACRAMDVLLAIDYDPAPGQPRNVWLLSKISDYLPSGTPVWGLVSPGSPLSELDIAHRSPVGHLTAAAQVLTTLARRR